MTVTAADQRADQALEAPVDPTDRTSIARARHRCATEAHYTRGAIERLAHGSSSSADMPALRRAVDRLGCLYFRMAQLETMAKAALQAQVDADPELAGATVEDDGRITMTDAEHASVFEEPRPSVRQEAMLPTVRGASRCAADLRARGFKVAASATARYLLVETPEGWTGTAAADVIQAHEGTVIGSVPAPVFDIVRGTQADEARKVLALMDSGRRASYAQLALFERYYDEARRAGYSPAGAATYVRQELTAIVEGGA
jgi:hypothetical protein